MAYPKLLLVFLLMSPAGRAPWEQAAATAPINKQAHASGVVPDLKEPPEPRTQSQEGASVLQKPSSDTAKDSGNDDGKANGGTGTLREILLFPGVLAFVGSLIAVAATYGIYRRTRALSSQLPDRTVRIEAQKLLLEINKQFLSNPELLAIYDDEFDKLPKDRQADAKLRGSLRAIAYMKINVFEIVFAIHPSGAGNGPWKAYFDDTVAKCTLVRKELRENESLYNEVLTEAFKRSVKGAPQDKAYPALVEYKERNGTAAQVNGELTKKLDALKAALSAPLDPKNPLEDAIRRIVVDQMAKTSSEGGAAPGASKV